MKTLEELVRPNIWKLKPYSSARDEYHGNASVFLDANENPYNAPYNRYPDPLQWDVKDKIATLKGIQRENILLGNGSDEPIDLMIRAFCEPTVDNIVAIDPTYGMYQVSADINNVEYRKVKLSDAFELDAEKLLAATDAHTKLIFLCSPNNPTGNELNRNEIYKVLHHFNGIVIVDEAYIDFSAEPSLLLDLETFPNMVVLQTFSKAWAGAGIRLGMAFASPQIISLLNKIKYPYNINLLSQQHALQLLEEADTVKTWVKTLLDERKQLANALLEIPAVKKLYPSDANFILIRVNDANATYNYLVAAGVIVRNRNNVSLCQGCLRITVGTPEENNAFLNALKAMTE